ncbi:MAG: YlbF family regulator [Gemmatimonadota bacterium]
MNTEVRERLFDKAEELGRLISQTAEYAYLQAANREIDGDREATEKIARLRHLQDEVLEHLRQGKEPPEEVRSEYESLQGQIQQSPRYQSLIASQANFDKLMEKVHRTIGKGIKKGEESRIILPS